MNRNWRPRPAKCKLQIKGKVFRIQNSYSWRESCWSERSSVHVLAVHGRGHIVFIQSKSFLPQDFLSEVLSGERFVFQEWELLLCAGRGRPQGLTSVPPGWAEKAGGGGVGAEGVWLRVPECGDRAGVRELPLLLTAIQAALPPPSLQQPLPGAGRAPRVQAGALLGQEVREVGGEPAAGPLVHPQWSSQLTWPWLLPWRLVSVVPPQLSPSHLHHTTRLSPRHYEHQTHRSGIKVCQVVGLLTSRASGRTKCKLSDGTNCPFIKQIIFHVMSCYLQFKW